MVLHIPRSQTIPAFGTSDAVRTVGGPLDTWGHTWDLSELDNSNFGVQCSPTGGGGSINLDQVQVKIYYEAPGQNTYFSTGTFTVPTGVTSITVQAWGGGGRGGNTSADGASGGGGGGAFSNSVLTVTPGATYTVNVGQGSSSSSAGGDSWVSPNTVGNALVLAKGGNSVNVSTQGASGGLASNGIGDIKFDGGNGANAYFGAGTDYGGGGGSSAGTSVAGNYTNTTTVTTTGATAPSGGGNGGDGRYSSDGNGSGGTVPGGGGGGALRNGGTNYSGGAGGNGKVIITYTPPPALTASTLDAFGIQCINNTYGPNSFTITGTNLTNADVLVGPLDGFTFSTTSGGTYETSLTLTQPGGDYSQQIFVKFSPIAEQTYSAFIPVGGGGASVC